MLRILSLTTLAVLAIAGSSIQSSAEDKSFDHPQYKKLALDWCYGWATECGQHAADAWCVKQGYESASHFTKWENAGEPTRIISSNQICDEAGCSSFTEISCHKADKAASDGYDDEDKGPVHYEYPMAGKRRVDWCYEWATDCGKPAADYYCKVNGQDHAVDFKIDENISKTRILHSGQKCTDPECDGFKYIDCE
jgi:hypothetical protein